MRSVRRHANVAYVSVGRGHHMRPIRNPEARRTGTTPWCDACSQRAVARRAGRWPRMQATEVRPSAIAAALPAACTQNTRSTGKAAHAVERVEMAGGLAGGAVPAAATVTGVTRAARATDAFGLRAADLAAASARPSSPRPCARPASSRPAWPRSSPSPPSRLPASSRTSSRRPSPVRAPRNLAAGPHRAGGRGLPSLRGEQRQRRRRASAFDLGRGRDRRVDRAVLHVRPVAARCAARRAARLRNARRARARRDAARRGPRALVGSFARTRSRCCRPSALRGTRRTAGACATTRTVRRSVFLRRQELRICSASTGAAGSCGPTKSQVLSGPTAFSHT